MASCVGRHINACLYYYYYIIIIIIIIIIVSRPEKGFRRMSLNYS